MHITKRLLLGLCLAGATAGLTMENLVLQPAYAAETVSLFKVITSRDEIVIGIPADELSKMEGNAGGIAKALVAKGSLSVNEATGNTVDAPRVATNFRRLTMGYSAKTSSVSKHETERYKTFADGSQVKSTQRGTDSVFGLVAKA